MRVILIFASWFMAVAFAMAARGEEEEWKTVENQSFSFSVPPSFKKTSALGVDSFVEEYSAEEIELSFDYGPYSNNFREWPKATKFEKVTIDGKAARIGTVKREFRKGFPYNTQIHIKVDRGVALSMFAACRSEKELDTAIKIFKSIEFRAK